MEIFEKFKQLLTDMVETKIPDIHIISDDYPYIRRHNGSIVTIEAFGVVSRDDVHAIILGMIGPDEYKVYEQEFDYDCSYRHGDHRFRVNLFHDSHGCALAIRYIPTEIPSWQTLGIPQSIMDLLANSKGLILVT